MDKDTRNAIERATQRARRLLEDDFAAQLEGDFDVQRGGAVAEKPGPHLSARQVLQRDTIVAALEHKRAAGLSAADAVTDYLRDAAFTTLNRFVALKMLEARELVQECVTKGEQSAGYREFHGLAPGLPLLPDSAGYRLYIESLFDELSTEVKVLFDRRDSASALWPKHTTFEQLLQLLNATDLSSVWTQDETIGWVYQYFNGSDERRRMREESHAPRNSRELAVRNQFFTPRYVVQFLTDNTLGRIWYEMRGTKTVLADRCEYLVRRPNETFPPRAKKDPRDVRVLDPACGSGHFLLYAFDLFLTIYEEAHSDADALRSEATGRTLAEDYPSLEELRKATPGLILAHNLHGVDIDARCAQIAQLALWMRAQRAYHDYGIAPMDRPRIRRSQIVVAEPLVADERIAHDFVARLGDVDLERAFLQLVGALKLAGDLGFLLRLETLLKPEIAKNEMGDIFAQPAERIRAALERFVTEEGDRANTRKRLFAEDAEQGIGLLTTAEKKFDVALMNPPFGAGSTRAKKDFEKAYPRTRNDIYAAFVERGIELLSADGRLGAITSRTGFFLSSFQKWRENVLLLHAPPVAFADLGQGVLDGAMVEVAAYALQRKNSQATPTVVFRLLAQDDKKDRLRRGIELTGKGEKDSSTFITRLDQISAIPGSPLAYWLSDAVRGVFRRFPAFEDESEQRTTRCGLGTLDDFRFLRLTWEIGNGSPRWTTYHSGGTFSPFYEQAALVVRWSNEGAEVKAFVEQKVGSASRKVQGEDRYHVEGFVFPRRTKALAPKVMPRGGIFSTGGQAGFAPRNELLASIALLASRVCSYLIAVTQGRTGDAAQFEVGLIKRVPWPLPSASSEMITALSNSARRAWSLKRSLDTANETSPAFLLPPGLNEKVIGLDREAVHWELGMIEREIGDRAYALYEIGSHDRAMIELASTTAPVSAREEAGEIAAVRDPEIDEADDDVSTESEAEAGALISWLLGVAFGRFDPRLATRERPAPPEPEPFDPLPTRSPGMWPQGEEPADEPAILVDDEGQADDLVARVQRIAERVGCEVPENLRTWLARELFPLHIRMYSRSRRKAPIYWQLATPSASYSVWLYIHAFTGDAIFRIQNDYMAPKLAHEERRLERMRQDAGEVPKPADRRAIAAQEAFVEELRVLLEEVKRVAPLWNPDLDDGVIINFAPLWRLVPHLTSWQRELKSTWDELYTGEYDWSHLAMYLWPERVVPKCANDRSLAIAHGLEEVFWVEGTDGKWSARSRPTRSTDDLIRERTSPAVKAALKGLLEAPVAASNGGRGRGRRRRSATTA